MRNFFYRIQNALARFMYGRNGTDQLNIALLVIYLILWLVGGIVIALANVGFLYTLQSLLMTVLAVLILWRTFSRNLSKRRAENQRFLNWWLPLKSRAAGAKARRADKEHRYFTCKNCKTICRVPAGKGKIEITCPKCGHKLIVKS